ncbi:MupG family TIM beta-alpha barrel fold protein [Amphibacillus sp. Q70]|uniref:MupG family TIM beta-alpha barrel fold protein n=1 Tax=Amphibacillus sp. Q70 TaxID=3453416 RepID=UPI003F859CD7
MFNRMGLSVYISTFDRQKEMLKNRIGSEGFVFTSFHISEEVDEEYLEKAVQMCDWLYANSFSIIADVSPKTLEYFNEPDLVSFAEKMHIDVLRLDYGFTDDQIKEIAEKIPLAYNASTMDLDAVVETEQQVYAMHNFYPRPETGLDQRLFNSINDKLIDDSIEVMAFIPGDEEKRAPIKAGLPTVESHRNLPPYLAYLDMVQNYKIDHVFIGDVRISEQQFRLIETYQKTKIIQIPVQFTEQHMSLYQQTFTIRIDSPQGIMRLQESRGYASAGDKIEPNNCKNRIRGMITMDNLHYQRYSGEIQILREDYPEDWRVNVIGEVSPDYLSIVDMIKNGDQIQFIQA